MFSTKAFPAILLALAAGCGAPHPSAEATDAVGTVHFLPGWSGAWDSLGGYGTSSPSLTAIDATRRYAYVRGGEGDLWRNYYDGARWSGWQRSGIGTPGTPSVVSATWSGGSTRLTLAFARGNDNALYLQTNYNNGGF